jgi:prophage tail gpP-like protein
MTGRIFTSDHKIYELPALLEWNVTHTGGVPCDSYSVTFLYKADMAPILKLAASFVGWENGRVVARGIVDEYTVELGSGGLTATISGRGVAARLLDNESRPVTYQDATLAEIVRCHVAPYGVETKEIADVRANSVYTVPAGVSQWKAVADFCRTYGGFVPRFAVDGTLLAAPERDTGKRLIIDENQPVLACTLREDHYGVLTEALAIDKKRNASYSVKNQDMIDRGGHCRRVIYTPGQSTWAAMRYTGEYQIEQSKQDEKIMTVTLPGSFLAFPGDRVALDLKYMGQHGTFRVEETENTFSVENGAATTLTLKECDNRVAV